MWLGLWWLIMIVIMVMIVMMTDDNDDEGVGWGCMLHQPHDPSIFLRYRYDTARASCLFRGYV